MCSKRREATYQLVADAARAAGLTMRGGFHPRHEDRVPDLDDGRATRTLVLLGNAGPEMWMAFEHPGRDLSEENPLDGWSRAVINILAQELDATPLYPFGGPPWLPFVGWAQRAEAVHPSPIGPLIHPEFGLWHAYRGALAFPIALDLPPRDPRPCPCDACEERPCLSTCPVGAFAADGYDVPACTRHVDSERGRDCRREGCRARRACPVGTEFQYLPAQAEFHMRAFLRARREPF